MELCASKKCYVQCEKRFKFLKYRSYYAHAVSFTLNTNLFSALSKYNTPYILHIFDFF